MASVDELSGAISADVSKSDETHGSMDNSKGVAEELIGTLQAAGVDDKTAGVEEVKGKLDEAQALQASVKQKLEEAMSLAESLKGLSGAGVTDSTGPPRPRQPTAQIGDPVTPGPVAANPYRQELNGADDTDKSKSKASRIGRGLIRNVSDLSSQSKDTAKVGYQVMDHGFRPPGDGTTYETVGVAEPVQPSIGQPANAKSHGEDTVSTAVMIAAVAVEGFTRMTARKRERKRD